MLTENTVKIGMIKKKMKEISQDFSDLGQMLLPELPDQNLDDILISLTKIHADTSIICMKLELSAAKRGSTYNHNTIDRDDGHALTSVVQTIEPVKDIQKAQTSNIKKTKVEADKDLKQFSKIYRFISSEEDYCNSLHLLLKFQKSTLTHVSSREKIKFIFGNLDSILSTQQAFLEKLTEFKTNNNQMTKVVDILVDSRETFQSVYCAYASNYSAAIRIFKSLALDNSEFADSLLDWEENPIYQGKSLEEYLYLPITWILDYGQKVQELLNDPGITFSAKEKSVLSDCKSMFDIIANNVKEILADTQSESPCGIIRLSILEARGVKSEGITGTSDSAIVIYIEEKEVARTKTITNAGDPKWNQSFDIVILPSMLENTAFLQMELIKANSLKSESIGKTEKMPIGKWVDCNGVVNEENLDLMNAWGNPSKSASLREQWQPIFVDRGATQGSVRFNAFYFSKTELSGYKEKSAGIVSVTICEGKFQKTNSYVCRLNYEGKNIFRTTAVTNSRPIWNSSCHFFTERQSSEVELVIECGSVKIATLNLDLCESMQKGIKSWYHLGNENEICVGIKFHPIELDSRPNPISAQIPIGALKIVLISIASLPDTVSSVYVKSYLQGRKLGSSTIQDTYNEIQWNETFYTPIYNFGEYLIFDLFESSTLVRDKKIGRLRIKIASILGYDESISIENLDVWSPILRPDSDSITLGSFNYQLSFTPVSRSLHNSGILRLSVDNCTFTSPGRYYLQFQMDDDDLFQTLACPENLFNFDYCSSNDQFIPDLRNRNISVLLRLQTLDKSLPHDRIVGAWSGALDGTALINFSEVGESIIAGNAFGEVVDVGTASIQSQTFYLDLDRVHATQSNAISLNLDSGIFKLDFIKAFVPNDGGGPCHFVLKLNGKDLDKTKEYKTFGDMNETFSFSLNDRITSILLIQLCRDQFSVTSVLATSKLPLDGIFINRRQELEMQFEGSIKITLKIAYVFEVSEVSRPARKIQDEQRNEQYFEDSSEKIGRRSTNRTQRPSTYSKRSSVSRQSSYLSQ